MGRFIFLIFLILPCSLKLISLYIYIYFFLNKIRLLSKFVKPKLNFKAFFFKENVLILFCCYSQIKKGCRSSNTENAHQIQEGGHHGATQALRKKRRRSTNTKFFAITNKYKNVHTLCDFFFNLQKALKEIEIFEKRIKANNRNQFEK